MVEHVLVPVDGSPQSAAAVAFTTAEWPDAELTLLHVVDPVEAGYSIEAIREGAEEWHREKKHEARELLSDLRERTGGRAAVRTETGRPARTILDVLDERTYDHVVMGSHGRQGVTRILLGSVTESVLRESPVPVTIVRGESSSVDSADDEPTA